MSPELLNALKAYIDAKANEAEHRAIDRSRSSSESVERWNYVEIINRMDEGEEVE